MRKSLEEKIKFQPYVFASVVKLADRHLARHGATDLFNAALLSFVWSSPEMQTAAIDAVASLKRSGRLPDEEPARLPSNSQPRYHK